MAVNKEELLRDAYANIAVSLPLKQVAELHKCSPQYVSQVCKGYGIKVDKQRGTLSAPLSTIKKVFPAR